MKIFVLLVLDQTTLVEETEELDVLSTFALEELELELELLTPSIIVCDTTIGKHCEYDAEPNTHTYPGEQTVGPVHPIPPHCPYGIWSPFGTADGVHCE